MKRPKLQRLLIKDRATGFKESWYHIGEIVYAREIDQTWLPHRYHSVDVSGGISFRHCRVLKGWISKLLCLRKEFLILSGIQKDHSKHIWRETHAD